MRAAHVIIGAALIAGFVVGCSKDSSEQRHSTVGPNPATDSGTLKTQLDQIRKDYGVVLEVRGHTITVGTPGLATTEEMQKITDALRKAYGDDFTNYTVTHIVK